MRPLRIPLRAVFYKDSDDWVVHCLEFDLAGSGPTKDEAVRQLSDAVRLQLEATVKNGNWANLFFPADSRFFTMFAAGKDVAVGELLP
jgi:hypothetical protein